MKLPRSVITIFLTTFCILNAFAQNAPPSISDMQVLMQESENRLSLSFEVADEENDPVEIGIQVSIDGGESFSFKPENITGDVGLLSNNEGEKEVFFDLPEQYLSLVGAGLLQVKLIAFDDALVDLQALVDEVSPAQLDAKLQTLLISGPRHRAVNGGAGLAAARTYLKTILENLEWEMSEQIFDWNSDEPGENIIARKPGLAGSNKVVILDAHYDTVNDAPGADDNGTGLAGILEAARIFRNYHFRHSIDLIAFDLEEAGLIGSINYVADALDGEEEIIGVINYDMIGFYDDTPNSQEIPIGFDVLFPEATQELAELDNAGVSIIAAANAQSAWMLNSLDSLTDLHISDLNTTTLNVPDNGLFTPDLRRSDHAPFWDFGIPALFLTDGAETRNPNYHTPNDVLSTVDPVFHTNVVRASLALLADIAEPLNASSETITVSISSHISQQLPRHSWFYPNPSTGEIYLNRPSEEEGKIEIRNVAGALLFEGNLSETTLIDLSELPSAILLARIVIGDSSYFEKLLLIE